VVVPLPRINFLYTNIGRGHPFYLDGILEALIRKGNVGLVRGETDVFEVSRGLSRSAWKVARLLYHKGSSPGIIGAVYNRIRSHTDYNRSSAMLTLMGKNLRERFMLDSNPIVVAHPTLVAILKGKQGLIYQHGEIVAPREALVKGASTVLVPTEQTAEPFIRFGYNSNHVVILGLCIEPSLVRQAREAFAARLERIEGNDSLVGAFFSSGAEPRHHVDKLVTAAASVIAHGGKVILLAQKDGVFAWKAARYLLNKGIEFTNLDSGGFIPNDLPSALIVRFASRREENSFTAQLFPMFDYLVAPSHERTNWALGLGLPMFIVNPPIGPFAPLNRNRLIEAGVAGEINSHAEAELFGQHLNSLRSRGKLVEMAQAGWEKLDIHGFDNIAEFLINNFAV